MGAEDSGAAAIEKSSRNQQDTLVVVCVGQQQQQPPPLRGNQRPLQARRASSRLVIPGRRFPLFLPSWLHHVLPISAFSFSNIFSFSCTFSFQSYVSFSRFHLLLSLSLVAISISRSCLSRTALVVRFGHRILSGVTFSFSS